MKFLFYIPLLIFILGCDLSGTNTQNANELSLKKKDSIADLLVNIHAKEKAYRIDTLFKNKVRNTGFNGCVLVAQHGQVIYKQAFGYSDLKLKDSLNYNSAFQLASASKTLTAAAVLLLKDRGQINLTDPIQKFFPKFPYEGVNVQMLLTHRSGLGNYIYFCEPYCDKPNEYKSGCFDNKAVLEIIETYKPEMYAKPGKKFEYCNTNYALLALIVEKVSGMSFPDFMDSNIFNPLGMKNTWVNTIDSKEKRNKTSGYNGLGKPEADTYADDVLGDKGIYSTIEDMYKWDQALYSEKLLKKSTIEEAFMGYSNEHKGKRNYGYGWRTIDDGKNPKIIYHNGWWHGYNSLFLRRPADQATIIVLSNKYNRSTYHVTGVLDILNEDSLAGNSNLEGEE